MSQATKCLHCDHAGFVRQEHVIQGGVAATEYFCGRCEHMWIVREHERRKKPRPKKRILRRDE